MLKKLLLALCVSGIALNACAAGDGTPKVDDHAAVDHGVSPTADRMVRKALQSLAPQVEVDSVAPAALPGFYQVIASGQLVYVSTDGKYLLHGDLVDLASKTNVSDQGWAKFRQAELAKVPASESIVYAPAHPKYTVTIFTDVNCGYCRALHKHIADFNKAGIAVKYLAWPREGITTTAGRPTPTYTEMVSVWCAADRKAAFNEAKNGHAPKSASCTNPVESEFDLGVKLGVSGTPTIIAADGRILGGYVTPTQLLKALQGGS